MKSTAKFAAFGLAAVLLASCSDNTSNESNSTIAGVVATEGLSFTNDAAALASRVHSYKGTITKAAGTRAAADPNVFAGVLSMPSIPEIAPANLVEVRKAIDLDGSQYSGKAFNITGKNTIDCTNNTIKNATIYIDGGSTLVYGKTEGNNKFYVQKGATLKFAGTGEMLASTDVVICQEGTVESSNNNIVVNGEFYADLKVTQKDGSVNIQGFGANSTPNQKDSEGNEVVTPSQNITFNNKTYIDGYVRAVNLTIGNGAVAFFNQNAMHLTTATVNGALHANKYFKTTGDLTINGQMSSDWAVRAGNLKMNAGSKLTADYVRATDATLVGACQLNISDKGVLTFDKLTTDNAAQQIVLSGADAVAVIKAGEFHNTGAETIQALATPGDNSTFLIQFTKSFNGATEMPSFEDLDIAASYLDYDKATNGDEVKEIQEGDPSGKWGVYQWTGDAANLKSAPKLDIVAAIDANDGQSATCIKPVGSNLYVSYHTNGSSKFGGNIERATVSGNTIKIEQSFKDNDNSLDYNHLTVDGSKLYLAGSSKKNGGFVTAFALESNGAIAATNNPVEVAYVDKDAAKHQGYDVNCVVPFGNSIIAASTRGYEVYDAAFATHSYLPTAGKAKHLAVANNAIYGLNFNTTANTTAQIQKFGDATLANATIFGVGELNPDTAKNVIAVDGTDVYVCRGKNGVTRFDANGNQTWQWNVPTIENEESEKHGYAKGYANGLAVDNQYVYVACGGYGLVVLDKTTGKEVCHRKSQTGKSANYVALGNDGKIYVAYGQSRIQVFKVTSTKK